MRAQRILKWSIPVDDQRHEIGGGRVVHIACQFSPESVQVWTEEDADGRPKTILAKVVGTGQTFEPHGVPVGSAITANGELVWHVVAYPPAVNYYKNIYINKL